MKNLAHSASRHSCDKNAPSKPGIKHLAATAPAFAYTEAEVQEIFQGMDANRDGKITRAEYNNHKVHMIYRNVPTGTTDLTFEQTKVSRAFFDAADVDHSGVLTPTEIIDALPFEAVDVGNKGYFTLDELRRFLDEIGR
jgi:Ca2+-binding EF-hand superfamily protein